MRTGWEGNVLLQERIQRADAQIKSVLEIGGRVREDIIETTTRWNQYSSRENAIILPFDGGATLDPTTEVFHMDQPDEDGTFLTELPPPLNQPNTSFFVGEVLWGSGSENIEFGSVDARLIARIDSGSPQEVATWWCDVYRVSEVDDIDGEFYELTLEMIGTGATATPGGPSAETVIFNFDAPITVGPAGTGLTNPVTVVVIQAFDANHDPAGNCGWVAEGTAGSSKAVATGQDVRVGYYDPKDSSGLEFSATVNPAGVPAFSLVERSFGEGHVTFADAAGRPDLGEPDPPTGDIQLIGQGETPSDSQLIYEIRNPTGPGAWLEFRDGDFVGQDNTLLGGGDLTSLPKRSDYDMRVRMLPNSQGTSPPTARRMGLTEREGLLLGLDDRAAKVERCRWALDPLTLRGEIGEIVIRLLRTGEVDYRDPVTQFLSRHHTADVDLRVYIAAPGLPRANWLLVDVWEMEDWDSGQGADLSLFGISPSHRTRTILPRFDTDLGERPSITFENATLRDIWTDLLQVQLEVPERFLPPDSETDRFPPADDVYTRTITDESDGKEELDAVAWLGGGSMSTSQGRIVYMPVIPEDQEAIDNKDPREYFRYEEVRILNITPGYRSKVTEFSVPFEWDENQERFLQEHVAVNKAALLAFHRSWLDPQERLEEHLARWLTTQSQAQAIGTREVDTRGAGVATAHLQFAYAHPHLEVGDWVGFRTDRFVGKELESGEPLKGMLDMFGVIVDQTGIEGREFIVWMLAMMPPWVCPDPEDPATWMVSPSDEESTARLKLHPVQVVDPSTIQVRIQTQFRKDATGGDQVDYVLKLDEDGTEIGSWTLADVGADWTGAAIDLTQAQIDAVTDWAALYISLTRAGTISAEEIDQRSLQVREILLCVSAQQSEET